MRVRSENSLLDLSPFPRKKSIVKFLSSHCRDIRRKAIFAMVNFLFPSENMTQDGEKKAYFLLQCPKDNRDQVQHKCQSIPCPLCKIWGSQTGYLPLLGYRKLANRCRRSAKASKITTLHCRHHKNVHIGTCTLITFFPSLYLLNSLFSCLRRMNQDTVKHSYTT